MRGSPNQRLPIETAVDIKVNSAPPRPTWDDYCDRCYAAADAARRAEQRVAMGRPALLLPLNGGRSLDDFQPGPEFGAWARENIPAMSLPLAKAGGQALPLHRVLIDPRRRERIAALPARYPPPWRKALEAVLAPLGVAAALVIAGYALLVAG